MSNDTIHERKRQRAVDALTVARDRETTIKRRLGVAAAEGLDTSTIRKDLADCRDEIAGLEAALPVYDEAIAHARLDASATQYSAVRDQLDVVVAKRREAAQAAELAMRDLCDAVNQSAALGRQTVALSKQLGLPYPDRLGNHHVLPLWLAANVLSCSPEGLAGWPSAGANPQYASAGLPSLEEDALSREGL